MRAGDVPIARDGAGFGAQVLSAATGEILGPINAGPAPAVAGGVAYALSGSTLTAVAQSGLGVNLWQFTGDGNLVTAPLVLGARAPASSFTTLSAGAKRVAAARRRPATRGGRATSWRTCAARASWSAACATSPGR